jgi:hypothetical protein
VSITKCEYQSQQNQNQEKIGQKSINVNNKRDGDYWEYYVSLEAWKRGAEVFRNLGSSGKVDMILLKDGDLIPCDVKQNGRYRIYNSPPDYDYHQTGLSSVEKNVYMICIHPISLKISWNTKRVPLGWEDFWK